VNDALIERRFELGEASEVVIRLSLPVRCDADFRCDYEIAWPDRKRVFNAFGIDSVQALILALRMVHAELLNSPEGREGQIRWLGSDDLGLPLPDSPPSTNPT
jgi:hypothetical protein